MSDRNKRLGSTDVSAILGLNPRRTAYEVWLEKLDRLEEWKGNRATDAGTILEPAVLDYAEAEQGPLRRNVLTWAPAEYNAPIASTLDAKVEATGLPVEAKTSGIVGPVYGHWGDVDTDEVPDTYLVQVCIQILCTGAEMAYLYALLGGRGIIRYQIPRDEAMLRTLANESVQWWERHIERGIEPEMRQPVPLEVVKRLRREADKRIELRDATALSALARWLAAKEEHKRAEDARDEAQAAMILQLGDAEAALLPDGRELTYFKQGKKGHYVKESSYRVLRIRKAK